MLSNFIGSRQIRLGVCFSLMDSSSRLLIKQNERLIKSLDIMVLKPYLINSRIFTSAMLRDIFDPETECNLFSELPSRGPLAFSRFLQVLDEAGYKIEAKNLRNGHAESEVQTVFYPMTSQPLGYCIIINNVNFYKNDKEILKKRREGSLVDASRLRTFFEGAGYAVEVRSNLRCEEMRECLEIISKSEVLKLVHSCIVIILTHGSEHDVLYDINFSKLKKQEVYDIFNNTNCKNLRNKPKIFLFQACRGGRFCDSIVDNENSDSLYFSLPHQDFLSIESTDAAANDVLTIINNNVLPKFPTMSDMIVIHSSLPDHVSYLDLYNGSWLVDDLLSVFEKDYLVQDLESMLKAVSRKLQDRLSLVGQKKQVLHTETLGFNALLHICSKDEYQGLNKHSISYLY